MNEVLFLPPSDRELDEAFCYYEDQFPGLGVQFLEQLFDAIRIIQKFPPAYFLERIK